MALPGDVAKIKDLPTIFVVFGATGDLSRKKIFPSFFELFKNKLLPEKFKIIAAARTQHTPESFVKMLDVSSEFAKMIDYLAVDVAKNINLDGLSKRLDQFEKETNTCSQRILYMAITPDIYEASFENLGRAKLHLGCQVHNRRARIVIEKPFGYDWASSQRLHEILGRYFEEEAIYRIDHFLGKETVQNILALRFANEIFEPVWNRDYVDHVQITLAERSGIEKRGVFYDKTGALRDVVQNHLFQLLALITMEQPAKFDHQNFSASRIAIIKSIKKLTDSEIVNCTVRGQYEGYRDEENVKRKSQTETFCALRLYLDNDRWRGIPFYFRTGKRLMGDVTSIILTFKEKGHKVFGEFWDQPIPNHLTIQIMPAEGIGLRLAAKKPGLTTELKPIDMEFCYERSFDTPNPNAYERLLMDIMLGDQTLFLGRIGPSWQFIDPIEEMWRSGKSKLTSYKPGSWGPKEADKLITRDGRQWLAPLLTICKI